MTQQRFDDLLRGWARLTGADDVEDLVRHSRVRVDQCRCDLQSPWLRAFHTDVAKQPPQDAMRPPVLMDIKLVEHLALSDAGRKVAERFGIHVADVIDPQPVHHALFRVQKLPQLRALMSPAWAIHCAGFEDAGPG